MSTCRHNTPPRTSMPHINHTQGWIQGQHFQDQARPLQGQGHDFLFPSCPRGLSYRSKTVFDEWWPHSSPHSVQVPISAAAIQTVQIPTSTILQQTLRYSTPALVCIKSRFESTVAKNPKKTLSLTCNPISDSLYRYKQCRASSYRNRNCPKHTHEYGQWTSQCRHETRSSVRCAARTINFNSNFPFALPSVLSIRGELGPR